MKKSMYGFIAVFLCIIMCFSYIVPGFAAAIPSGVTAAEIENSLPKVEKLTEALLSQSSETADIKKTVYSMLFSDDTLNSLFEGVYSALSESQSAMSVLGIDLSVAAVAENFVNYPNVYEYLINKENWNDVLGKNMTCQWGVTDKTGFSDAVSKILKPLDGLLYALLCGSTYRVNVLVYVDGGNGYQNGIVPILQALGCPSIMSQENFSANAKNNKASMVKNILAMLYASIDGILVSPVTKLCEVLPCVAYFIKNDGIKKSLETIISPLKLQVGVIQVSGLDKILENAGVLSDSSKLTDMFENMDLSSITGSTIDLELPDFDLDALAACCTFDNGKYTTDKASAVCEILRWAFKLFRLNKNKLLSEAGGLMTEEVSGFIDSLLAKSDDELIKMIFDILSITPEDTVLEYSWTYAAFTPSTIEFTPNLTEQEYIKVLNEIDDTLNEFMKEFGDGALSDTLRATVYSNSLVTTLVKTLYGALYSEETAPLLSVLGLDASTSGVAKLIKDSYPNAAKSISAAGSWDKVNENDISWGFTTGSRKGFENAVITVLRPLIPFLDLLLAEGEFELLGAITIGGSNGYNTAVIPILEGLGCENVKSYSEYKSAKGTDNALKFILDPICDLIDTLIEKPVATICEKLPNIVYFVNSGSIKQCVDNLLYPVNVLLKKVGMSEIMPDSFNQLGEIDIGKLVTQLSDNGTIPFKLPAPDLNLLGSLGTATELDSKRTYNGLFTRYTYIKADAPAVLVTVLRYFIDALSAPENGDAISSLMSGTGGTNDMFAMYAGNITEQFKSMNTDEIIEWLYNLLFRETPKKEIENNDETIPTIIYEPKEDHTVRNIVIIALAVTALITLVIVYFAKRDPEKHKKRRKPEKGKSKPVKVKDKTDNVEIDVDKAAALNQKNVSAPKIKMSENSENIGRKDFEKLKTRQEKAVKKAVKGQKKADKYYEKALKEAAQKKLGDK